jgi:hypothetical protein
VGCEPGEAGEAIHEHRIVRRAAHEHGHDHADRLPAHDLIEHQGPFVGPAAFRQGIEDQRLVGAAGHPLRHAAQDPIG